MTTPASKMCPWKKVLLIDDDLVTASITEWVFEEMDQQPAFFHCENGREAFLFLQKTQSTHEAFPDVVLLDLNMPVVNGFEFIDLVRNEPNLSTLIRRIVVLTSSLAIRDMEETSAKGVRWYLEKPLSKDKIVALQQAIGHRA